MTSRIVITAVIGSMCRQSAGKALLLGWLLLMAVSVSGQTERSFLLPPDSLSKPRFWAATGTTAAIYTATVIGLNEIWYDQFERTGFHFFNDWGEWANMDKMGHLYTAYFESQWIYSVARWTGMSENAATWTGAGMGVLLQGTIEVLDAYSAEWGFSVPDFAFNVLGAGSFLVQQKAWGEQRILWKVSSTPGSYPPTEIQSLNSEQTTTLRRRANDLFGSGYLERFIKDYNAQTVWASINPASFMPEDARFPKWLNVAVGYGADNMYGGFENAWMEDGAEFEITDPALDRYRQYYLSLDIDFSRIPSRSPFVRTLLGMLNVFKFPAPAIEFNRPDGVRLHALHF